MEYGFFDNQLIGVDDLNGITQKIVSNGIARAPSSVADLNNYLTDVVTSGVVPSSDTALQVSVVNDSIKIAPGTAFFENGTYVVLENQENIDFPNTFSTAYIYLVSSMNEMRVFATAETTAKTNGNGDYYLLLATINTQKEVTDCRKYAKGKAAYYGSADLNNNLSVGEFNLPYSKETETCVINVSSSLYESVIIKEKNGEALYVIYLDESKVLGGYIRSSQNSGFQCGDMSNSFVIAYHNGSTWAFKLTKNADNITLDFTQDDWLGGAFSAVVDIKLIAKKV